MKIIICKYNKYFKIMTKYAINLNNIAIASHGPYDAPHITMKT